MFAHNGPHGGMPVVSTIAASDVIALSCASNTPAASYWLLRVLDDDGRQDCKTNPSLMVQVVVVCVCCVSGL